MPETTLTTNAFRELLDIEGPILADGAMGTSLFSLGLMSGDCPERWNVTEPERVLDVHRSYLKAGSDIVLTNSFGGNGFRLKLHGLQDEVFELNQRAAALARSAIAETGSKAAVAGSMGPTGELLEPMGTMTAGECADVYAEQARGLDAGGADVLWLETLSDLNEVSAALGGVRSASDLPVVVTMSFDTNGRTMMGLTATDMAIRLVELEVDAFGANCGNNLADTELAVAQMQAAAPGVPIVSKANAGIPQWKDAGLVYSGTPEVMAAHAHRLRSSGVRIIGGCCGSAAEHLAHMRQVIDGQMAPPDIPAPQSLATLNPESGTSGRASRRGRRGRNSSNQQ